MLALLLTCSLAQPPQSLEDRVRVLEHQVSELQKRRLTPIPYPQQMPAALPVLAAPIAAPSVYTEETTVTRTRLFSGEGRLFSGRLLENRPKILRRILTLGRCE